MKKMLIVFYLLQAYMVCASQVPTYPYRNTTRFSGHAPSPCTPEIIEFFRQTTGKDIPEGDLCWPMHDVKAFTPTNPEELRYSVNITGSQYTDDILPRFQQEITPHGLPSGDKHFFELYMAAKTPQEREAILEEWGQRADDFLQLCEQVQWGQNTQAVEPLPEKLNEKLSWIPDTVIADKKEGDELEFTVDGQTYAIVCTQRFLRLGLREQGVVRNITFHDLREFLLKRHKGEITMTDAEIRAQGGWPIKKTGYEPYLFGWRWFFISKPTYDKIHKEHYQQRWED